VPVDDGLGIGWTVLIALISGGLAGGVASIFTTRTRIAYEREEQFRERLISAADEFSREFMRAAFVLTDADRAICGCASAAELPPSEEPQVACDEAHNRLARVELLFGHGSSAGNAANGAIEKLRAACGELVSAGPGTERTEGSPYVVAYDEAIVNHERFTVAAHSLVRPHDSMWSRWRGH